jgi:hypothetical protein
MGQRNALGLGGDDIVILRSPLEQLPGAGHGQLLVTENHEAGDGQRIIEFADGQISFKTCHGHGIEHGVHSLVNISAPIIQDRGRIVKYSGLVQEEKEISLDIIRRYSFFLYIDTIWGGW